MTLRARFFLIALLNLAVLGLTLALFIHHQLGLEFQSFLMAAAREKIFAVSRQLTLDLSAATPASRDAILARYSAIHGVEFRLYAPDGLRLAGPDAPLPPEVAARLLRPSGPPPFLIEAGVPPKYWIGVRTLLPSPDLQHPARATLLLVSPTLFRNPFFFDWEPWLLILLTAIVLTALCWLPLVGGLTRDIGKMTATTAAIAAGHFDAQVETHRADELGRLGHSINRMSARLRDYLHGQKRFLGDVAHELRSPLGRMQVALEILERRTPSEDLRYLADLKEDVEILSSLTTELLTFARAELNPEPAQLRSVPLLPIVQRAAQIESPGAAIDVDPTLTVMADETLLLRAIANLIRNAACHAPGSPVTVTARRTPDHVLLTIDDEGPGVPEEALEKIFTPFFRLDTARQREKGGTGLGLAIARHHIEACGGSIQARNRSPHGLSLCARLVTPASSPAILGSKAS